MDSQVCVKREFVTPAERAALVAKFNQGRDMGDSVGGLRTQVTATGVDDIRDRCVQELREFYDDPNIDLEHWSVLVEMRAGDSQPLHADAQQPDGAPNHTPWRTHVALVYLTTDGEEHEGGALHLPQLDLTFPPEAGLMVGFPATKDYMHEVLPVVRGARLNLATWMRGPAC